MTTHTASNTIAKYRTASGANQRLVVLAGSPHERASLSLIPESTVLLGDRNAARALADEINARPLLNEGDLIWVQGYGDEAFTVHRHRNNRDWWHVVPVGMLRGGKRYYVDFQGESSWAIRDASKQGESVSWGVRDDARKRAGIDRVQSLSDVERVVEMLHEMTEPSTWDDYRVAIGETPASA